MRMLNLLLLGNWFSRVYVVLWWYYWGMEVMIIYWRYERGYSRWFAVLIASSLETTNSNTLRFWVWTIRNQWLWALLFLSFFSWLFMSIKIVSVHTRLTCSLGPWRSLKWLDGCGRASIFGGDCRNGCM